MHQVTPVDGFRLAYDRAGRGRGGAAHPSARPGRPDRLPGGRAAWCAGGADGPRLPPDLRRVLGHPAEARLRASTPLNRPVHSDGRTPGPQRGRAPRGRAAAVITHGWPGRRRVQQRHRAARSGDPGCDRRGPASAPGDLPVAAGHRRHGNPPARMGTEQHRRRLGPADPPARLRRTRLIDGDWGARSTATCGTSPEHWSGSTSACRAGHLEPPGDGLRAREGCVRGHRLLPGWDSQDPWPGPPGRDHRLRPRLTHRRHCAPITVKFWSSDRLRRRPGLRPDRTRCSPTCVMYLAARHRGLVTPLYWESPRAEFAGRSPCRSAARPSPRRSSARPAGGRRRSRPRAAGTSLHHDGHRRVRAARRRSMTRKVTIARLGQAAASE